jgi:endonuclease/exonuclease/phosphatase (EEP) superfamily protein YafD
VSPAAKPLHRSRAHGGLGRAGLAVLLATPALVLSLGTQGAPSQAAVVEGDSDITIVQANMRSPQSVATFQQDEAEVLAEDPDLITYNEVGFRNDQVLAPDGYALWRKTTTQYTRHNAVAWRTDTWHEVDHGTRRISNYTKKPPGRTTLLGLRYANWVSLESIDGRRLSLVSTHVSPPFRDGQGNWIDLLRPSVRRVGLLVQELASHGPVLVGGDFNANYGSARYPRDLLTDARMHPTYDMLGTSFPTGDHHGATIDYLFVRGTGQLQADWHRPVELNSDHDAVVAGLSWTTEPPQPVTTTVSNQPDGTAQERRAVVRVVRRHLAETAAGETVRLTTWGMNLRSVDRALRNAEARGVRVRVTSRSLQLTRVERRLRGALDANGSWLRHCQDACRARWGADRPPSLLLVTGADGQDRERIDVSRPLRRTVITRRTTAEITSSTTAMDAARAMFAEL